MANVEKQKAKLTERILILESDLKSSLQKKTAGTAISVPKYMENIRKLQAELAALK